MGRQTCQMQLARWVAAEGGTWSQARCQPVEPGRSWSRRWREVGSWLERGGLVAWDVMQAAKVRTMERDGRVDEPVLYQLRCPCGCGVWQRTAT